MEDSSDDGGSSPSGAGGASGVQVKGQQGQLWAAFFQAPLPAPDEPLPQAAAVFDRGNAGHRYGPDADGRLSDERISHLLGRILRYHLDTVDLLPDEEGFVDVDQLLASCPDFHGTTAADVRRVGQESRSHRGSRFELRPPGEHFGWGIRATYRHPRDRRIFGLSRRRPALPFEGSEPSSGAAAHEDVELARPRLGFSRPPPHMPDDEDDESDVDAGTDRRAAGSASWAPAAAGSVAAAGPATGSSFLSTAEAPAAAAGEATRAAAPSRIRGSAAWALALKSTEATEVALASNPPAMQEPAPAVEEKGWERFLEPGSRRPWFWNAVSGEVFFADDEVAGWERFEDAAGRPWWWHEASGRFFFHSEGEQEDDDDDLE